MRDFFDSNRFRHSTTGIAPLIIAAGIGAAGSLAGGALSARGQQQASRQAQQAASVQQGRDIANQLRLNQLAAAQQEAAARGQDLGAIQSGFGGAEGGFLVGDEFITEEQAIERGLIREEQDLTRISQAGADTLLPTTRRVVDPSLVKTTRTRLDPELESVRQQALGFQGIAGEQLQAGFQGIDEGLATRELELLQRLAAPREAERREQLFGFLQRTGRLESTPGASIFAGAEEAIGREGLRRELAARDIARLERDRAFEANLDLFGLGSETTRGLFDIESSLANRLIATSRGGFIPQQQTINVPSFARSPSQFRGGPSTGELVGSALAGFSQQLAGADFSGLFGGQGGAGTGGGDFLATPQQAFAGTRADELFGQF